MSAQLAITVFEKKKKKNSLFFVLQEGCKGLLYMVLQARVVLDLHEELELALSKLKGLRLWGARDLEIGFFDPLWKAVCDTNGSIFFPMAL